MDKADSTSDAPALSAAPLSMRPLESSDDFASQWGKVDLLVLPGARRGAYQAGFASSERCVEEAQRLRYEVFNLELGEGLASSALSGLDRDPYDDQMTHLVLLDTAANRIVGTYRIQTISHALGQNGVYAAQLFDLAGMEPYFAETLEVGRACLAQDHRTLPAILTLWTGLGEFMNLHNQRYLFGCCSLTSQDPDDGWRAMKTIRAKNYLHPELKLRAKPQCDCGPESREFDPDLGEAIPLPKLFRTYMRLSAKVVSGPAIDREFGTVDFLVLMDGRQVNLSQLDILK